MAKKVQAQVKLQLPAAKATPAKPVGTALGPQGINLMEFCKQFNAKTGKEPDGMIFPVLVTVYTDRALVSRTGSLPSRRHKPESRSRPHSHPGFGLVSLLLYHLKIGASPSAARCSRPLGR